jgi:hypothetical protein
MQSWVDNRFQDLLDLAAQAGEFNSVVKYDQYDNVILEEKRDFLNNLTYVKRRTRKGEVEDVFDEDELVAMDITTEEVRKWH